MTNLGWLLAFLFGVLWVGTELQKRTMKKLMQAYEQRLRSTLSHRDDALNRIWNDIAHNWTDRKLAQHKARAIVKKSVAHKLNHLKLVDE